MKRPAARRTPGARAPLLLTVPALLAVAFLMLPLVGVLARTSWGELGGHLAAGATTEALRLSLLVSLWALGLSLLLGVPLAWLLARVEFPGRGLVRALVTLPLVLPPVVGGVALLMALGRNGVPVYVLYRPGQAPVVLSELLGVDEVRDAVRTL